MGRFAGVDVRDFTQIWGKNWGISPIKLGGFRGSGFWFLVSGFRFQVSGFWFLVSGFWFLVVA